MAKLHLSRRTSLILTAVLFAFFFLFLALQLRSNRRQTATAAARLGASVQPDSGTAESSPAISPPADGGVDSGSFMLDNFQRSEIKNGKKYWEIKGVRGAFDPMTSRARIEQAALTVFRDGRESAIVQARQAVVKFTSNGLENADLTGDVVLTALGAGITMKTEAAVYDQATSKVHSAEKVTIEGDGFSIVGRKLSADVNSRELKLGADVESVFYPKRAQREGGR